MSHGIASFVTVILLVAGAFSIGAGAIALIRLKRFGRIETLPDENGEPHACAPGTFNPIPILKTRHIVLSGRTVDLDLFQGLYCSVCGRELCCEACGKTPARGSVLSSKEEGKRVAQCCRKTKWALRLDGATITAAERSRANELADRERFRWN